MHPTPCTGILMYPALCTAAFFAFEDGLSPLHVAMDGKPALVRLLVQHGAALTTTCVLGKTPLHLAAQKCGGEFFDALLGEATSGTPSSAAAAVVDARLPTGETPLHLACESCSDAAVGELLARGADPNLTVNPVSKKNAPLHVICKQRLGPATTGTACSIIEMLIQHGALINANNSDGDTVRPRPLIRTHALGALALVQLSYTRSIWHAPRFSHARCMCLRTIEHVVLVHSCLRGPRAPWALILLV